MEINEFVKYRREQLGLTQQQIADAVGVGKATISKYELDVTEIKALSWNKIVRIADALHIDPMTLVNYTPDKGEDCMDDYEIADICRMLKSADSKTQGFIKGILVQASMDAKKNA